MTSRVRHRMQLWVAGGGVGRGQNLKLVIEGSGEGEKSHSGHVWEGKMEMLKDSASEDRFCLPQCKYGAYL